MRPQKLSLNTRNRFRSYFPVLPRRIKQCVDDNAFHLSTRWIGFSEDDDKSIAEGAKKEDERIPGPQSQILDESLP